MIVLGLLRSRKLILRCTSDRPDVTWRATREIRHRFSHEETLRDGTSQSVGNEVMMPRDRPERPDIDLKKGHGLNNSSLETMELSVESRSFVNQVNDHVRKRQKRISNVTEKWRITFNDWVSVHDWTMESAAFMG